MKTVNVLQADDDQDDCLLTAKVLDRVYAGPLQLTTVSNGEALLAYLDQCTVRHELALTPMPDLVLLDINMPCIDGREAIAKLRANTRYQAVPVIVLTTSDAQDDINLAYSLGANSYISKALTFNEMVETMAVMVQYWFNTVKLPQN